MLALILCLLLDILAIVQYAREALHPKTFLNFNLIQSVIWLIIIAMEVGALSRGESASTISGILFSVFIL